MLPRYFQFLAIGISLIACMGCQQRAASKLLGRWEGRPDSAATRAAREAEKFGDETPPTTTFETNAGDSDEALDSNEQVTDWESYDVTIAMDFVSSEAVKMTLNGGQAVEGTWRVVATNPSGCTIEVETKSEGAANSKAGAVRRRFELLLDDREGVTVGFQLTEAGADAQLGAIYFQRVGTTSAKQ